MLALNCARRNGSTFLLAARIHSVDTCVMQEPFFFEGGVVDLAADAWDFRRYPKVQRVVNKASIRRDLADIELLLEVGDGVRSAAYPPRC